MTALNRIKELLPDIANDDFIEIDGEDIKFLVRAFTVMRETAFDMHTQVRVIALNDAQAWQTVDEEFERRMKNERNKI